MTVAVRFGRLFAVVALLGIAGANAVLAGMTAAECKIQSCEKNAAVNEAACAELPFNPSCKKVAESQRRECHRYCDDYYPVVIEPDAPDMWDFYRRK